MPGMTNALPFSSAEYDRRLSITREAMEAAEIDVLIATDPSNQHWLTGYDGWSFYVHQAVVLPLDGKPVWWGRNQDANGANRTVDTDKTEVIGYPDYYVQSTERHPMHHLAGLLIDMGHGSGRIGMEMDNYYFSAKAYLSLAESMPDATLIDATGLVNWRRGVKSDEEIAFMRKAAKISEKITDLAIERAEPGVRKNDLVAEIIRSGVEGIGDDWGDYPAILPLTPSGADACAPHLTWNGDPMKKGEATFFELSGCYRRYHAPLCRTVFLGEPTDTFLRAEAALIEALENGLDQARAGNVARDVAEAVGAAMDKAGIQRGARCGYPIGLSYPPDWGERTISFRLEDETELKPGMTFHFMPGLWIDDGINPPWGMEMTESILIRDKGPAETFCDIARKLFVKP